VLKVEAAFLLALCHAFCRASILDDFGDNPV